MGDVVCEQYPNVQNSILKSVDQISETFYSSGYSGPRRLALSVVVRVVNITMGNNLDRAVNRLHLFHPHEWLIPSTASRSNSWTAHVVSTSQSRTANDHGQGSKKKRKPSKTPPYHRNHSSPSAFERAGSFEPFPRNTPIDCVTQTLLSSRPHSYPTFLEPNGWPSMLYCGTVDGTRILLVGTVTTLRLVRYIMPVPVLGLGRKPSATGLGFGRGDCD